MIYFIGENQSERISWRGSKLTPQIWQRMKNEPDHEIGEVVFKIQPEASIMVDRPKFVALIECYLYHPMFSERDRNVFRMRRDGLTLKEVSEQIGISRERVRQLEAKVVRWLWHFVSKRQQILEIDDE